MLGAAIVVQLEDWLSLHRFGPVDLVTGAIFVLVVLLFRRGIWGTVEHWLSRRRRPGPPTGS